MKIKGIKDYKGSGMGDFEPVRRITKIDELTVGMIIICVSHQFKAVNVARVMRSGPGSRPWAIKNRIRSARFVSPTNPRKKRLSSDNNFSIWDFELNGPQSAYYTTVRTGKANTEPAA